MKKAFTLVETLVAVGALAMVVAFASVIFKVGIDSYRTAGANAEIMLKLRAITDQLNADFKGLRKDAPILFWFQQDPSNPNQRYDQMMFFSDGDFQSVQLYDGNPLAPALTGEPLRGNVARIYYGQAMSTDSRDGVVKYPFYLLEDERLFASRRQILAADEGLAVWPNPADVAGSFGGGISLDIKDRYIEIYEHDSLSLAQWKTLDSTAYGVAGGTILNTCFDVPAVIDMYEPRTFHKLVCEGVGSFTIQWGYRDDGIFRWFPSDNPDGSGTYSHFDLAVKDGFPSKPSTDPKYTNFNIFGVFFKIPDAEQINYWGAAHMMSYAPNRKFPFGFYPPVLKFTFTLYDSKGIFKNGRTFTHIVYIGE